MGGLCWEGMTALRRLILVLLSTFVSNVLVRHITITAACLAALILQVRNHQVVMAVLPLLISPKSNFYRGWDVP